MLASPSGGKAPLLGDEASPESPEAALIRDAEAPAIQTTARILSHAACALVLVAVVVIVAARGGVSALVTLPKTTAAAAVPLATAALPDGGRKVRVDVYGMAGCPFTRAFVEGPLSETVAVALDLIDLHLHAFGNSYHVTRECGGSVAGYPFASYFTGYDQQVRECWDSRCGSAATVPAEDCFEGPLLCQHGATDGMVTTAWACAKHVSGMDAAKYMPFVRCSSLHFLKITSHTSYERVMGECASSSGLDRDRLITCATGDAGQSLLRAEARDTVPHPAVPYVLIDGVELRDTSCVACGDGIMQKVCEAWRAHGEEDTPTCRAIFGLPINLI